jgi:hypothetical protein
MNLKQSQHNAFTIIARGLWHTAKRMRQWPFAARRSRCGRTSLPEADRSLSSRLRQEAQETHHEVGRVAAESRSIFPLSIWRPLEDGAEIGTIDLDWVRRGNLILATEYEMKVDTETELQIMFNETNCCDGIPVQHVLLSCIRRVSDIAWLSGRQFFGE